MNLLDLPLEVRQTIWDMVFEDTRLEVHGADRSGEFVIRRLLVQGQPAHGYAAYPPHPLAYVQRNITLEIQDRWLSSRMLLGETRFLSAGIFSGITHLSLSMDNAVRNLAAIVPRVPSAHTNPVPPSTPFTLKFVPALQELEIRWKTNFQTWYEHEDKDIAALIARLSYFRRSFKATIKVEAFLDNGEMAARGSLLDDPSDFEEHRDANVLAYQSQAFLQRMEDLKWNARCLRSRASDQRKAVHEAHPFYRYVPLGWVSIPQSNFRMPDNFRAALIQGRLPRPYDS